MALSMAIVMLGPSARVSDRAIRAELTRRWPDLPKPRDSESKGNTFAFDIGDLSVAVGHMPAPVPWSDLEEPCEASILWPESARVLRSHATHLIVTVLGDEEPLVQSRLLTQVTAAILATCKEALGVFWTNAELVIQPPLFIDFATKVLPEGPPLEIWVDFRVGRSEGKTRGFTRGMAALGLPDLECEDSPESPGEFRKRLMGLARYLLENGLVIKDGDTFGESASERIKVRFGDSTFGGEHEVMRLEYPQASGKRRRRRRSKGSAASAPKRSGMTAYGYVHAVCVVMMTIGAGILLHWLLADVIPRPLLRHLLLDVLLLIGGFIFLVVSDSLLQKMFGLQAFHGRDE